VRERYRFGGREREIERESEWERGVIVGERGGSRG